MTDNDVKQVTLTLNTAQAEQKLGAITQRLEEVRAKKAQAFEQGNAKVYTLYTQETKNSSDKYRDNNNWKRRDCIPLSDYNLDATILP